MYFTQRRKRFRAILSDARCVHPASVYDPLSAQIAEDLCFEMRMSKALGCIGVTSNPTVEWIASRVTDAFPWDEHVGT